MNVAIIGITGMVGKKILEILSNSILPINKLFLSASKKSFDDEIYWKNKKIKIKSIEETLDNKPDLVFFSAGDECSRKWVKKFSSKGSLVIDNSSVFRLDDDIKLIIPEINFDILTKNDKIISNPNCSTIQLVMVLSPLDKLYKINRVIVSTYQSVSGSGKEAVRQLTNEKQGIVDEMYYPYEIYNNCIPHCDTFHSSGYTREELKLINETKKIISDSEFDITATAVRVPVIRSHSESVNISFQNKPSIPEIRKVINESKGLILRDFPETNTYPMPKYATDKDEVFVGRIREDNSYKNSVNLWIVSDNLRKGAAKNAIQIAEKAHLNGLLKF